MALALSSPPSSFSLCALGHRPHIRRFSHSHSFLGRNLLEGPCDGGRRRISHSATRAAPPKRFHVCAQAAFSELAPVSAAVYGTLLLGGGLFAYSRSSSKGSLLGGLSGGALMGLVYILASSPDTKNLGEAIGFGTGLLFAAVFGIRLAATKKLVPAAPLLLLSIAATAIFYGAYFETTL